MSLPPLPWEWISAGLAALVIVLLATRNPRRRRSPESHRTPSPISNGADVQQAPDHRLLAQAAAEMRSAAERQSEQMEKLRTFWSQRLDALEAKVDALSRPAKQPAPSLRDEGGTVASYAPLSYSGHGEDSSWLTAIPAVPSWSAGPADQAVEIRDGALVRSRSLPPAAYVTPSGAGQARVYLNPDVQMTEISLPKWEVFFDLQGGRTYTAYRTTRPAEVRWDEGEGRGELVSKGLAEAI
ncbi:hypothetical protein [Longimicrobium sp.]|jgi:hypothetical protein|uniref:hypothetical protein n=1 Tax=Longimicrobium sp. TaxID=2029185 RepID=UPI002F9496EA